MKVKYFFEKIKRNMFLGFLLLAFNVTVYAQTDSTECYLVLRDGKVIKAKSIEIVDSLFIGKTFIVDKKKRYKANEVVKYKDLTGEYKNAAPYGFIKVLKKEPTKEIELVTDVIEYRIRSRDIVETKEHYYFYNDKNEQVPLNYKNLKQRMIDDPKSLKIAKKARNLKIVKGSMMSAGLLMGLTAGLSELFRSVSSPPSKTPLGLVIAGGITIAVPYFFLHPKKKYLKAVKHFNAKF